MAGSESADIGERGQRNGLHTLTLALTHAAKLCATLSVDLATPYENLRNIGDSATSMAQHFQRFLLQRNKNENNRKQTNKQILYVWVRDQVAATQKELADR